jgi:protein-S-isoprenylcysteine O-methyltransferase Ste14
MTTALPLITLLGLIVYGALAVGWRSWLQWRRTGSTGFRGMSGHVFSAEWLGGALLVVAFVLAPIAPLLAWLDVVELRDAHVVAGSVLFACGFVGTLAAQLSMGDAWRIGVDANERTELVARGLFRCCRNPIFTSMIALLAGIALLVPNAFAVAALVAGFVGLEIQVRLVEEPYLLRTHGDVYARYASRVGRFVPFIGRFHRKV